MNFDLAAAIRDKKTYPDNLQITVGDGLTMTLGEMREYQSASGQDVAKQIEAERNKMAEEQRKLAAAQEEVVNLWTKLQEAAGKTATAAPVNPTTDWTKDPFFAPVAEHLEKVVMSKINELNNNYSQIQKALGLGVKYITDTVSEQRYAMLPEDFRKETPYEAAVRTAAEKKFLDSGGVPDVRKVYDEWRTPRERKAEAEKIQKEAYDKARQDLLSSSLARPSGMPVAPAAPEANGPKNLRDSFNRLKEDPEFLSQIYNLTGQA
jgi:hypothetical protein